MLSQSKNQLSEIHKLDNVHATQQYGKLVKWLKTHYLLKNSLKIFN